MTRRDDDHRHTPEVRLDPFTGDHSIVAKRRSGIDRGGPAPVNDLPQPPGACPFCPGNEAESERTVLRVPQTGPWAVRVVPNLYPWVAEDGGNDWRPPPGGESLAGLGVHDVVIEHPDHDARLVDYDAAHLRTLLTALRDRVSDIEARPGVAAVSLFRNRGRRAGSSQPHPHMQVLGAPVLGPAQRLRDACARRFHERSVGDGAGGEAGQTLLAAVMRDERETSVRVVGDDDGVLAWCPFAPRHSYQLNLALDAHAGSFSAADDDAIARLATALPRYVSAALRARGAESFNIVFHLPPVEHRLAPHAFWWVEIAPRGAGGAGLELSTGLHMLSLAPEDVAQVMREACAARPSTS